MTLQTSLGRDGFSLPSDGAETRIEEEGGLMESLPCFLASFPPN